MIRNGVINSRRGKIIGMVHDLYDVICDNLKNSGFLRVKPLFPRSKQIAEVYAKDGRLIVVHGPYRIEAKNRLDVYPQSAFRMNLRFI